MKVNGEDRSYGKALTVAQMLEKEGYDRKGVAVEANLQIVPKAEYDTRVLKDTDNVEVVKFLGGG